MIVAYNIAIIKSRILCLWEHIKLYKDLGVLNV